ncbi:SpoIIE family protein phosphatase [Chloroflexia bacterium SDU3-3]|nr:SpoIIE family protein phosphatase [Chloroflexia bacterium SDU3-3]
MLAELVLTHREHIASIAQGWIASGAGSFSIGDDAGPICTWPSGAEGEPSVRTPLIWGGRSIGWMGVAGCSHHEQPRLASEAQLLMKLLIAERDLDQMTNDLIETQDQLLAMYDLTSSARNHLGLAETMRALAAEAARLLHTDAVSMFLMPLIVHHPHPIIEDSLLLQYVERAKAHNHILVINEGGAEPLPGNIRNLCVMPISVRGKLSAGIMLFNKSISGFIAADIKLIRAITEHAGMQIEQTLLYQESLAQERMKTEMHLARQVQQRLLPQQAPAISAIDVYAESRSALQVGGDFFYFVEQPARPLFIAVGDVAGKGISAAMIMAMLHASICSAAKFMPHPSVVRVLARANEDLYDDFTILDAFATTFVAQYTQDDQLLRYTNAGHSPVIFCPAESPPIMIESDGPPIGVLPAYLGSEHMIHIRAGDLLIVATDGFSEAQNAAGELYGYDRLLALIDSLRAKPALEIANDIFGAIDRFSGGRPQDDDQTLVVIKGKERDKRTTAEYSA